MRICVDLTSLADNFSGIERFALSITKELIKNDDHQWILLFKNSIHKELNIDSANIRKIIIKGNNKLIFNQLILPLELLKIKADRYFFPAFPAPFFFFNKNSITTIHDLSCWDCPFSNKKHMILYFKIMYWKSSLSNKKIVTVSEFSKERICSILQVKPQNIEVVYNGISELFFKETSKIDIYKKYNIPKKYLLCLSTLEPRKNLKLLIQAYNKTFYDLDIDLVLAGRKGWMMDDILNGLSKEVVNRIHFTGFIDDEDLPEIYRNATYFVFPSLYEGFGIPPLEAMATGTPVLSSDAASMPEVLGDAAFLFRNNDLNDLCDKLVFVLNDEITEDIKKQCVKQAKKYSWTKSSIKLLKYICS